MSKRRCIDALPIEPEGPGLSARAAWLAGCPDRPAPSGPAPPGLTRRPATGPPAIHPLHLASSVARPPRGLMVVDKEGCRNAVEAHELECIF